MGGFDLFSGRLKLPRILSRGLNVEVITASSITRAEHTELFEFYKISILDCERDFFDNKFSKVGYLFLIRDDAKSVIGMCGFSLVKGDYSNGRYVAICPSNTILSPALRGDSIIEWFGMLGVIFTRFKHPFRDLYCAYIGSTIPIYLVMAKNYQIFWPHPENPIPQYAQEVMEGCTRDVLMVDGFDWNSETWNVTYSGPHDRNSLDVNRPNGKYTKYVDFYQSVVGDDFGVMCLTPMSASNLKGIISKAMARTFKKRRRTSKA